MSTSRRIIAVSAAAALALIGSAAGGVAGADRGPASHRAAGNAFESPQVWVALDEKSIGWD
ncbi:hypothetical protein FCH28_13340 [Streptomyces piniterrae]|uniref:Uncharacterized protein n=1 Tax=Streptomyces piniterrae TaxID=2571125 RepID=A0A4U0NIR6_9ACTN|nr:hypothetical protein [Streptomyces piniterrae]TJZ54165.1 hypothetical protein FCH28_13340 [Streptomyces piniterrae]